MGISPLLVKVSMVEVYHVPCVPILSKPRTDNNIGKVWGVVVWRVYLSRINLMAPRVGGLKPSRSIFFCLSRKKNCKSTKARREQEMRRSGPHRSGKKKRKNRQANQDWLRERHKMVRVSSLIKWSTPSINRTTW